MKKHTVLFAELITSIAAEDQATLARFVEEHRSNQALSLFADSILNYAESEALAARQKNAQEYERLHFERFVRLEKTVAELQTTVLDSHRQAKLDENQVAQELKTQWQAENKGIQDSFRRFLVIMGTLTCLGLAAIYGFARHEGARHRTTAPVTQSSPEE